MVLQAATQLLLLLPLLSSLAAGPLPVPAPNGSTSPRNVSWDSRSLLVDGDRLLLTGGEVDYARSTPGMWPTVMRRARENGLNCIASYVFWNLHEESEGAVLRWDGRRDLRRFLQEARKAGLWVHLRLGPYVNGNWDYGGLPLWLRGKPGMQLRSAEAGWIHYSTKWIRTLTTEIRDLFADRGGPVIMMQIENEYNVGADDAYMGQLLKITDEMEMGTPWTFCENPPEGAHNESTYPQWIFTCNHENCLSSQSGHYLQRFRQLYPHTPAVFTEVGSCDPLWTSVVTFDPGQSCPTTAESSAFKIARWFAMGGVSTNYFEWFGGNNYGTWGSHDTTTAYHGSSALNHFALPNEPKYSHLGRLHKLLQLYSPTLLQQAAPEPIPLGGVPVFTTGRDFRHAGFAAPSPPPNEYQEAHVWPAVGTGTGETGLVFLTNMVTTQENVVRWNGTLIALAAWSVTILDGTSGAVLFRSGEVERRMAVLHQPLGAQLDAGAQITTLFNASVLNLSWWAEPVTLKDAEAAVSELGAALLQVLNATTPPDQLDITSSDYVVYETSVGSAGEWADEWLQVLLPPSTGVTVYVDGVAVGTQNNAVQAPYHPTLGFLTTTTLSLPLPRSSSSDDRTLTLLATSFGTNDDRPTPMAGTPGVEQRRGILGAVLINRNASQPAVSGACKVANRGDYCANGVALQSTVTSVATCWAAASENASCGDEIVSNAPAVPLTGSSKTELVVGLQCFCIPTGQTCQQPLPSSVGNSVYKCHHHNHSGGVHAIVLQPTTVNLTAGGWTVRPGTLGEHLHLDQQPLTTDVVWTAGPPAQMQPALWLKGNFPTPTDRVACQSLAVDMQGAGHGHVFINGHDLGRYWLTRPSSLYMSGAVQRFYQVPVDWLCAASGCSNTLTVFEAQGAGGFGGVAIVQVLPSAY